MLLIEPPFYRIRLSRISSQKRDRKMKNHDVFIRKIWHQLRTSYEMAPKREKKERKRNIHHYSIKKGNKKHDIVYIDVYM